MSAPEILAPAGGQESLVAAVRAGADAGATGENAVKVACRQADVIVGALGIVLASKGYPGNYAKGVVIEGLDEVDGAVYHMGTASKEGRIVTAGGRVAIVVCAAPTLGEALEKCNREVGKVRCDNLFHRTDIGRKAIK